MAETPPREPDWSLLYRSLFASEEQLPEAKVREIMTNTPLKDLREWMFYGHPLFHEAVEQRSDTGFSASLVGQWSWRELTFSNSSSIQLT